MATFPIQTTARAPLCGAAEETFDTGRGAGEERASRGQVPWGAAGSKREESERLDRPDTSLVQVKDSKERI
jgi:hypothetical protein